MLWSLWCPPSEVKLSDTKLVGNYWTKDSTVILINTNFTKITREFKHLHEFCAPLLNVDGCNAHDRSECQGNDTYLSRAQATKTCLFNWWQTVGCKDVLTVLNQYMENMARRISLRNLPDTIHLWNIIIMIQMGNRPTFTTFYISIAFQRKAECHTFQLVLHHGTNHVHHQDDLHWSGTSLPSATRRTPVMAFLHVMYDSKCEVPFVLSEDAFQRDCQVKWS